MEQPYSIAERDALYRAIRERRDVRQGFLPEPLPEALVSRLLTCAHQAPSVGLMQPWRFILIRDAAIRHRVHTLFREANQTAATGYEENRQSLYSELKLEGLLEAPQHLCVVCDEQTSQGHGLGRQTMPETALYSAVCAVQNLWLAARAEGVGVGWVSILDPQKLKTELGIPERFVTVAYLCLGYVSEFASVPDLEAKKWEHRRDLDQFLSFDRFDERWMETRSL